MGVGTVVDVTRAQAQINYELDHTCDRPREGVHNAPVAPESGESVRFPIGYVVDSYLHERQSAHSGESLAWLEKLAALQETDIKPYLTKVGVASVTRVYTYDEEVRLDVECRGFLMFLEQVNVLDGPTREMVVDRVMVIDAAEFCLEDLKWVVLMVLFNVPGKENAYAQMEDLLFEDSDGVLH